MLLVQAAQTAAPGWGPLFTLLFFLVCGPLAVLPPGPTVGVLGHYPLDNVVRVAILLQQVVKRSASALAPKQDEDCDQQKVENSARVFHNR